MALKNAAGGVSRHEWDSALRRREPRALRAACRDLREEVDFAAFTQFLFFRQWARLKAYANQRGVFIIGDMPLFVADDSAEVWANPHLFQLDEEGNPLFVAGVPPDYFSPTGQRWGNPLYRWEAHEEENYAWWIARLKMASRLADLTRVDHFRGFAAYWEIPADAPTAERGRWVQGPGESLFRAAEDALGALPLLAEDLGVITPDVIALRDALGFPGMKVLQFAFSGGEENPFLPHHYPEHCAAYTGTHDNDTVRGWYETASEQERDFCRRYLSVDGGDISWDFLRAVWHSRAFLAVAPMQDFLSLSSEARMNFPGRPEGNWEWRMPSDALTDALGEKILHLNRASGRA